MSKRTMTTSAGPSGSGSSRRFIGPDQEEHYEILLPRTIQPERIIRFTPTGICGSIARIIEQRKWNKICEPKTEINVEIVREFYTNAIPTKEGVGYSYRTMVWGKVVQFSRNAINKFLGDPLTLGNEERCEYATKAISNTWDLEKVNVCLCLEGKKYKVNEQGLAKCWKREDLKLPVRALMVVFLNNIRPRGHVTTIPMTLAASSLQS